MTKVNIKNKTDSFSVLQVLGALLLVFAAADFKPANEKWEFFSLINGIGNSNLFSSPNKAYFC